MIHRAFFVFLALAFVAFATPSRAAGDHAPTEAQLADAIWIEGRVAVPEGTPRDEKLFVVADAAGSADFDEHRVAVGADHTFKVAFAKNAKRGRVRLAGRYLYLESDFSWKPGDATSGITLTPRMGSAIRGRLLPPPSLGSTTQAGANDELARKELLKKEIVGQVVKIDGTPSSPGKNEISRTGVVGEDATFEVGGLPEGYEYSLSFLVNTLVPYEVEQLNVHPGAVLVHDIALVRGATVRGIVRDEGGKPVADALIGVVPSGPPLASPPKDMLDSLRSAIDGTFEMRGIAPGTASMYATKAGYQTISVDVVALKDGEMRAGVEIPLHEGRAITGRALFSDGRPAAGAKVHASQDFQAGRPPYAMDVIADADGAFRVTGLEAERVKFTAMLEVRETEKSGTKQRKKTMFRAAVVEVDAKAREVLLTLELGLTIEGHVLDDSARLVQSFTAGAMRSDVVNSQPTPGSHVTRDVRSPDGSFSLDGLTKGDWYIYVYASSLAYPVAQRVTIPYTGQPLVFVMQRTATVSGFLFDADKKPVVGASVRATWSRPAIFGTGDTTETTQVTSGKDGRYELTDVYPGSVSVSATLEEREATPVPLTLKSGEVRAGVDVTFPR
jgi:hypothetical protein